MFHIKFENLISMSSKNDFAHFSLHNKTNKFTYAKCFITYSSILFQLDAQVREFILSDNCSTCFGRHYHPSPEAQNNCNYRAW